MIFNKATFDRLVAVLNDIAGYPCTCEDDTYDYADNASEEEMACPACKADIVLEQLEREGEGDGTHNPG